EHVRIAGGRLGRRYALVSAAAGVCLRAGDRRLRDARAATRAASRRRRGRAGVGRRVRRDRRRGAHLLVHADRLAERRGRPAVGRIRARYTRQTGRADVLLQRAAALLLDLGEERRVRARARADDRRARLQLAPGCRDDLVGNADLLLVLTLLEIRRDRDLPRLVAMPLPVRTHS